MSLASLLSPNNYNINASSVSIANKAINPTGNTNTIWSNNAFSPPHLMYGSTDLFTPGPAPVGEKGDKGDKGDLGEKGSQGDQGIKGETGTQGIKGDTGTNGTNGDKGETGSDGLKGDKGDLGSDGFKGDKGDLGSDGLKGQKGETGNKGDKGNTGSDGLKGQKGDLGNDGLKGNKGETGSDGLKGQKGDLGNNGDKGIAGTNGLKGATGSQGIKGQSGATAATGTWSIAAPLSSTNITLNRTNAECRYIKNGPYITFYGIVPITLQFTASTTLQFTCIFAATAGTIPVAGFPIVVSTIPNNSIIGSLTIGARNGNVAANPYNLYNSQISWDAIDGGYVFFSGIYNCGTGSITGDIVLEFWFQYITSV